MKTGSWNVQPSYRVVGNTGVVAGCGKKHPHSQERRPGVATDPKLETVFVNMDDQGMAVTLKKR